MELCIGRMLISWKVGQNRERQQSPQGKEEAWKQTNQNREKQTVAATGHFHCF